MVPSSTKKLLHETVQFLIGLVALAALTWLCAWLGFRPVSAALVFLILIALLSLAAASLARSLFRSSLSALSLISFPQLVHLDYLEAVVAGVAFLLISFVAGLVRQLRG